MQEPIWHHVAWLRRFLWVGPGWLILFFLLTSCDEGKRPSDPNGKPAGAPPIESWSVHEPVKDCTQCHGREPRRGFSSKVYLVAEVPQLCYQCHSKFLALEGWVHGPVAAGECLLCHNPHRTRTESLLRRPVPELCYQCHETRAIHLIDKHDQPSHTHCTDCHDGHASVTKPLLRPAVVVPKQAARREEAGPADAGSVLPLPGTGKQGKEPGQDVLAPKGPGQDALAAEAPGQDARATPERAAAELYYRSIRQYHAGRLREAREGFFQALKAGVLPDPMRETAHAYLEKIDEALKESPEPAPRLPQ
jgi:predicted CXXCH cytochrome family protein